LGSICLQNLNVLCLEALGSLYYVELDRLAFLEAPETIRLNCRKVHEDIFAILAADKTKSLCVVKPLHCSLFHFVCTFSLCFVLKFLLRRSDATESGTRKGCSAVPAQNRVRSNLADFDYVDYKGKRGKPHNYICLALKMERARAILGKVGTAARTGETM
jgi:hypothetical protein